MSKPSPLLCSAWVSLSRIAVSLGFSTLTECDMSNGGWRNSHSMLARGKAAKPSEVSLVKPRCPSSIQCLTSSSPQAEPSHTVSLNTHPKRYWHTLIRITSYTHSLSSRKSKPVARSTVNLKNATRPKHDTLLCLWCPKVCHHSLRKKRRWCTLLHHAHITDS